MPLTRRKLLAGAAALTAGSALAYLAARYVTRYDIMAPVTSDEAAFVLANIDWNQTAFPLSPSRTGGRWTSGFDRNAYLPDAAFATTFHVDHRRPDNTGDGLSPETAKRSIHSAIVTGNGTGQPYRVLIAAGTYTRADGMSNSGSVVPTQDCALIAMDGAVITGPFDTLPWSTITDLAYSNSYVVRRPLVARVFDLTRVNEHGDLIEIPRGESAAAVDAASGWAQDGDTLVVRRPDRAPVTNENTRVFLVAANLKLDAGSGRLYLRGIDFQGGAAGDQSPLIVSGCMDTVVIAEDCSFRYGGGDSAYLCDGVSMINSSGLFAFIGCRASANAKDGFNAHWLADDQRKTFVLTERCIGRDNGRFGSTSNNSLTGHETVVWVDVSGDYAHDHGGVVRFIDDSRLAAFGSRAAFDHGDGGATITVAWHTRHRARFWLWDCEGEMNDPELPSVATENENCPIVLRNYRSIVGRSEGVGISSF